MQVTSATAYQGMLPSTEIAPANSLPCGLGDSFKVIGRSRPGFGRFGLALADQGNSIGSPEWAEITTAKGDQTVRSGQLSLSTLGLKPIGLTHSLLHLQTGKRLNPTFPDWGIKEPKAEFNCVSPGSVIMTGENNALSFPSLSGQSHSRPRRSPRRAGH